MTFISISNANNEIFSVATTDCIRNKQLKAEYFVIFESAATKRIVCHIRDTAKPLQDTSNSKNLNAQT